MMKKIFGGIGIGLSEALCAILYFVLITIASDKEPNWTILLSASMILLSASGILLANRLDRRIVIIVLVFLTVYFIFLIFMFFGSKALLNVMWVIYLVMLFYPAVCIILCVVLLYRDKVKKSITKTASKISYYFYFGAVLYAIATTVLFCMITISYTWKLVLAVIEIILSMISLICNSVSMTKE